MFFFCFVFFIYSALYRQSNNFLLGDRRSVCLSLFTVSLVLHPSTSKLWQQRCQSLPLLCDRALQLDLVHQQKCNNFEREHYFLSQQLAEHPAGLYKPTTPHLRTADKIFRHVNTINFNNCCGLQCVCFTAALNGEKWFFTMAAKIYILLNMCSSEVWYSFILDLHTKYFSKQTAHHQPTKGEAVSAVSCQKASREGSPKRAALLSNVLIKTSVR